MQDHHILEIGLQYEFKDKELLEQALTHPSCAKNEQKNNLRLAFLGEAALRFVIVKEVLAENDKPINFLRKASNQALDIWELGRLSKNLGVNKHLLVSRMLKQGNQIPYSILAETLKAVAGAILCDGGFRAFHAFARTHVFPVLSKVQHKDPKTYLRNILEEKGEGEAEYRVILANGLEESPLYEAKVFQDNKLLGKGIGISKGEAQSSAARHAIKRLRQKA